MNPKASIVLPTYNRAELLPRAIESCLLMDEPDFELVIVSDGSTDDTDELMDYYVHHDRRIKYYKKENGGTADALNYGCKRAHAPVLMFAADDDIQLPQKVSIGLAGIHQPNVDFSYSGYFHCTPGGEIWSYCPPQPLRKDNLSEAAAGGSLVMWKSTWEKTPYRPMTVNEDTGWLADALKQKYRYSILDLPSFKYCMQEHSVSRVRKDEVNAYTSAIKEELR
jgi:glycosyltransferase involved in cell wall biosynthesis